MKNTIDLHNAAVLVTGAAARILQSNCLILLKGFMLSVSIM